MRKILANAAGAVCGAASTDVMLDTSQRPLIAVTTVGITTQGAMKAVEVPEGETVWATRDALAPGGRMAVLDFWTPDAWPRPLRAAAFALARPFGETRAMAERDLRPHLAPHLAFDTERSFYLDAAYLIAGTPV